MNVAENLHAFIWQTPTANNCNTYLIDGPTKILIDPGHQSLFGHVETHLRALKIDMDDIGLVLCTHIHPDHFEGTGLFKDLPALIAIHNGEWELVKMMESYMKHTFGLNADDIKPDFFVNEGAMDVNGTELEIIHTPGHSPGSVSIYWPEKKALFPGDVIFEQALGRTDLPGGKGEQLKESIRRLASLDVEILLPGHGNVVTGAENVRKNFEKVESAWFNYI